MPPARFAVGDRAEYWSDTYQQWMPGIVQRVRDGGAAYDLDVKKGAQASKLRLARGPAPVQDSDGLFSIVDRNHDGVISRSEFHGALQSHVIESSLPGRSAGVVPPLPVAHLHSPPAMPTRTSKGSSQPASARGNGVIRQEDLALQRRRPNSQEPEALSQQLRRRAESAVAAVDTRSKSPRSTVLQARQIHAELANATRAMQGPCPGEWAEQAGQDMVSRAGAVTVRKMVETTKALLQGLEGALILRAGFIAGCFHMWRCETTLSRAGRLYQEEFERHHDQWAAHLDHHRKSFEAELRTKAEIAMSRRERTRQQNALLLDTWAYGERLGLMRESHHAWRTYAHREKGLKQIAARIHAAVFTWVEGKRKGTMHSIFAAWRHMQWSQSEVRRQEAEQDGLRSSFESRLEEQQKLHDKMLQERLEAIEARAKKGHRDIEVVIAKWERGARKGLVTLVMQVWGRLSKKRTALARRSASVEMELRRWAEGKVRGELHCCFLRWKIESLQSSLTKRHQEALEAEHEKLQKMLIDQEHKHQDLLHQHMSEAERLRERSRHAVEVSLTKWECGDCKGLARSVFRNWHNFTREAKRLARKRQAVHSALLRSLEGDRTAFVHLGLVNWAALARSEKHARLMEERVQQEAKQWQSFLEETERGHESKLNEFRDAMSFEKAKAHAASELMLRRWMGGDQKGLQATVFADWKRACEMASQRDRKRNAVKDSVLRFVEGETRGMVHSMFQGWRNYVQWEAAHNRLHKEKDEKIARLEQQVQMMLSHKETKLKKYGEMIASRQTASLKGMCFSAWRDESRGIKGALEAQRREEVRLEEMARAHKMAETQQKEEKLKALDALGCKGGKVALLEAFLAWSYAVQRLKEQWVQQCNHNEAMVKYSSFIISQKLKKDAGALLAYAFSEWHRESKILYHQRHQEHAQRSVDESRSYVAQLEAQRAELQEQLCVYYQQIDLITETLQKELKTKEELATELRAAYSKMRKTNFTPTTAASDRAANDVGGLSRTSSDQTLDQAMTTPRGANRTSTASGVQGHGAWRLSATGVELPPSPSLPRCGDLLRGRGVSGGRHSREASPATNCGWEQAVERMGEEGMVRLERAP